MSLIWAKRRESDGLCGMKLVSRVNSEGTELDMRALMKRTSHDPEAALFNENGVTITLTHLTASGRKFELSRVTSVGIFRTRPAPVLGWLLGERPVFRLMVSVEGGPDQIAIESADFAFMERVREALAS